MLIDKSIFQKYDPTGMHVIYDNWYDISKQSYESYKIHTDFNGIDNIVFAGMGGSGTISDVLSAILSKTNIHVSIVKGYHLPKTVDRNTLFIATSISGNTTETFSVLKSSIKSPCMKIAFSNGGKMEQFCKRNRIEYLNIPKFHSPRASFTSFLYSVLKVLKPIIPIKESDIIESLSELKKLQKTISSDNLSNDNPSLDLARWISGMPAIYYPWGLQPAAIRFKNSLQENAKFHAMTEDVIEFCHNGIVAWEKKSNVQPILIQGKDDYPKTKERWMVLKEYFGHNKIAYKEVHSCKGGILSKLVSLIYLLDYASIYLAVLSKTDPSPIRSIDFIKKRLRSR